jgi:hypothetical protein
MIYRLIAKNEFDTPKILAMLNDESKIRRVKRLYTIDEILEVLGYNDDSMDKEEIKIIDDMYDSLEEWENVIYRMAIINGNFEQAIAMNKALPI